MKTHRFPLLTAFSAFVLCTLHHAVSQPADLPPLEPLRAPINSAWTVVFQYPVQPEGDAAKPPPPRLKSLSVQKQNNTYLEKTVFDDGTMSERLVLDGMQFETSDDGKDVRRLLPSDSSAADFSETDFPELAWVVGLKPRMIEEDNRQFLLVEMDAANRPLTKNEARVRSDLEAFEKAYGHLLKSRGETNPTPQASAPPGPSGTLRLFLDPRTKLPLRLETPIEARVYSYPSAHASLQVPEHLKAAYDRWRTEIIAASRKPSKP
jgi:hypothetical protein